MLLNLPVLNVSPKFGIRKGKSTGRFTVATLKMLIT
jgi:hypothetical protein